MAIFSAKTLISLRLALLTYVAYNLIISPATVMEYSGVLVLSSSMGLPLLMVNDKTPIYGTIGVVMITAILGDLAPLMDGNVAYFESVVFFRLSFFLGLCAYCYLGSWVVLCNSVVFAYAFIEVWFGILTFSTLKEEKITKVKKIMNEEAEYRQKFERGELSEEEAAKFESKVKEEEYQKIMQEFKK